jgi:hypothetical protein
MTFLIFYLIGSRRKRLAQKIIENDLSEPADVLLLRLRPFVYV